MVCEADLPAEIERYTLKSNLPWLLDCLREQRLNPQFLAGPPRPARDLETVYRDLAAHHCPHPTVVSTGHERPQRGGDWLRPHRRGDPRGSACQTPARVVAAEPC